MVPPVTWSSRADRLSDDALMAAVALGDEAAAAAFVRRFQRRVFGMALAMVGDVRVAEDVAQEAFERAWRHAATYDARRASVGTWLGTITRRLAIDRLRTRQAVPVDPADLLQLVGELDDPERHGVAQSELIRVRAALGELPVAQQRAVLMAAMGGQTSAQIAEQEGIPVGTAKTRLRLGLVKLRAALDATGAERA
jgi:RNA polymerase sigma-70 factor (ECF subfamily)